MVLNFLYFIFFFHFVFLDIPNQKQVFRILLKQFHVFNLIHRVLLVLFKQLRKVLILQSFVCYLLLIMVLVLKSIIR